MRNSETRSTKTGPNDAGLFQLFNETRLDERKSCAFAVSIRMEGTGDPHPERGDERSGGSRTAAP
ncbi:Protein of uncharacterised function (DUF2732) [Raoultella planticola]|uniref:Protein of uncharacterized function (DUF2732) n=1 Tax=Raoultella planticola TaxID=575 RepID=A0A485AW22_RAOPL|nr:Protein of uncharacterised function (DUF2732) [Raoultella planticola]